MKKLLLILTAISITTIFSACNNDIVNIGDPHKTLGSTNNGTGDTSKQKPSTIVTADSLGYEAIQEYFIIKDTKYYFNWLPYYVKFDRNTVRIDTASDTLVISIDIAASSLVPDYKFDGKADRVTSFAFKSDSIKLINNAYTNFVAGNSDLISMNIKLLSDSNSAPQYLSKNDIAWGLSLGYTNPGDTKHPGHIEASIIIFQNRKQFETQSIAYNFFIEFPRKKNI